MRNEIRWQTWFNFILGAWLFVSPWVLATTFNVASSVNAWILGALIFLVAIAAMRSGRPENAKWFNVLFGAWTFFSPWILGFALLGAAAWNAWIVGALVAILALWSALQIGSQRRNEMAHNT